MLVVVMHRCKAFLQKLVPVVRQYGALQTLIIEEAGLGFMLASSCDEFMFASTQVTQAYDKALVALFNNPEVARPLIQHIQQNPHLNAHNINEKGWICVLPFKELQALGLGKNSLLTQVYDHRAWISDYLMSQHICLDLQAQTSEEAIGELAELLRDHPQVDSVEGFINDIMVRERSKPTGIGDGIAIPHAKSGCVRDFVIAFGRSQQGISGFSGGKGEATHLVVLIGTSSEAKLDLHVAMLARLSTMLKQKTIRDEIMRATIPEDIVQLFINARPNDFGISTCFGHIATA